MLRRIGAGGGCTLALAVGADGSCAATVCGFFDERECSFKKLSTVMRTAKLKTRDGWGTRNAVHNGMGSVTRPEFGVLSMDECWRFIRPVTTGETAMLLWL